MKEQKLEARKIHLFSRAYFQTRSLYLRAFPPEQRYWPFGVWFMAAVKRPVEYLAWYEDGRFLGLTYAIDTGVYLYLFYIAVEPEARSGGVGSRILKELQSRHPDRPIVLDVEEPDPAAENNDQRLQRIAFYEKNGFYLLDRYIITEGHRLKIMSTSTDFISEEYWKAFRLMDIKTLARIKKVTRMLGLTKYDE